MSELTDPPFDTREPHIPEKLPLAAEIDRLRAELAEVQAERDHFKAEYQDEIGMSGLREERDAVMAQLRPAVAAAMRVVAAARIFLRSPDGLEMDDLERAVAALDANQEPERRHLFVDGEFVAHSGDVLQMKIDCDALTDESIATLAKRIVRCMPTFGAVHGIPRGGLRLAAALRPLSSMSGPTLIVDDVLTTGASMEEARKTFNGKVIGVVIFANAPWADWITPLWCDPKAERARIIAALREPCDALISLALTKLYKDKCTVPQLIIALADYLERQP